MAQSDAFLARAREAGQALNRLAQVAPQQAGKAAFKLFCTPRRVPFHEKDKGFIAAARQEKLELEGISIQTYSWPAANPDAPVVLFLHGWESNTARWQRFMRPLRQAGFHMMALDAPAQGNSGGDMLNLLLYGRVVKSFFEKNGAPYAVVGHSLGGAAALVSMGVFQAPPVKRAVVMGTFSESTRIVADFGGLLGLEQPVLDAVAEEIQRLSGVPLGEYSVVKAAAKLQDIKGLVIHDQQDIIAPVGEGRAIAAAWNAQMLETHGLGHSLQDKSVVKALVDFLL